MTQRISTETLCFVSVVCLAGSGKTRLFGHMIVYQEKIFSVSFDKRNHFHKHYQQHHGSSAMGEESRHIDIEFIQRLEWNSSEKTEPQKKRFCGSQNFYSMKRHREKNSSTKVLRHFLFQHKKSSATINWISRRYFPAIALEDCDRFVFWDVNWMRDTSQ